MNSEHSRSPLNHPNERIKDQRWDVRTRAFFFGEKRYYRDVWLMLVTACVVFALGSFQNNADSQKVGRKNAIKATCAVTDAVISAGQNVLKASADVKPEELERNLIRLGLPPRDARVKNADEASKAYAQFVSDRVEKQSGVPDLIDPKTGKFDCKKMEEISRVNE